MKTCTYYKNPWHTHYKIGEVEAIPVSTMGFLLHFMNCYVKDGSQNWEPFFHAEICSWRRLLLPSARLTYLNLSRKWGYVHFRRQPYIELHKPSRLGGS